MNPLIRLVLLRANQPVIRRVRKPILTNYLPPISDLRAALRYEEETGDLYWRPKEVFDVRQARWNGRNANKPIRCLNIHGYRHFSFKDSRGNNYKVRAHRAIFAMVYGYWPDMLDHINGNKTDNRLSNLRDAANYNNNNANRNAVKASSGFKGVCFRKRSNSWHAQITYQNKFCHLGAFDEAIDAAKAYDLAARKYFGEYAKTNADMGLL